MFGLFGRKSNSLSSLDDIKKLIDSKGSAEAGEIIRKAALEGNFLCQKFLSGAGLYIPAENRPEHVARDTELFTRLAAEAGDPESQFNLAQLYILKVNANVEYFSAQDLALIEKSKHWHRMAAAAGFAPSIDALKDLECFPDPVELKE
jgi:TPR repeat protein